MYALKDVFSRFTARQRDLPYVADDEHLRGCSAIKPWERVAMCWLFYHLLYVLSFEIGLQEQMETRLCQHLRNREQAAGVQPENKTADTGQRCQDTTKVASLQKESRHSFFEYLKTPKHSPESENYQTHCPLNQR